VLEHRAGVSGRRHAWDEQFSLNELKARLEGAEWYDDQAFAEYGLAETNEEDDGESL